MTTTVDLEQVTAFATAVRGELLDLGPDTLDELTDGLEADLADKLDDGEPLGDPAAYAAELRAAAGVEPAVRPSIVDGVRAKLVALRSRAAAFTSHPAVAAVLAFLVALRPLWWVIRAWGLFYVFTGFHAFPGNEFDPPFAIALLVLSIQWGRGRWLPWKWSRGAVIALSVIAAVAVPGVITDAIGRITFADRMNPDDYISDGLLLDKQQVTNIFGYGPDGQLLTDVRLYDQDGNPLSVVSDRWGDQPYSNSADGEHALVPSEQAGTEGWNVYPLAEIEYSVLNDSVTVPSWAKREQPTPPFASVQQLRDYEPPATTND